MNSYRKFAQLADKNDSLRKLVNWDVFPILMAWYTRPCRSIFERHIMTTEDALFAAYESGCHAEVTFLFGATLRPRGLEHKMGLILTMITLLSTLRVTEALIHQR